MANVIRLKRASGSDPTASDLVSGEPAVRTDTGELFFKKDDGSVAKVSGAGGGPDFKYLALRNAANNGAASFPNADFTLVTSGTTSALTPTAANTLLVSVNGVIQKPNTGTSTPSQGFALSGSTIKFGANISAAPDFILYQESGGIGEPSDDTVSEVKLKVSNSPVNGYFLSAQSGNNGGLTWAAPVATSCTGNSATATALATARTINGTSFDGTANITVTAAAGTLTGNTLNSSVTASSLTSLGDLAGLTVDGDMSLTGANYNVLWDKSDNALEFADNAKASFGASNDLEIVHNSSENHFLVSQNTFFKGNIFWGVRNSSNQGVIEALTTTRTVDLYGGSTKVLSTSATGVTIRQGFHIQNSEFNMTTNGTKILDFETGGTNSVIFRHNPSDASLSTFMKATHGGAVELYHDADGNKKLETTGAGVLVSGGLTADGGNAITLGDNKKIVLGTGSDLEIYHSGSDSLISNSSGALYLQNTTQGSNVHIRAKFGEESIKAIPDGSVQLYHNNVLKFQTSTDGVDVNSGHLTITDNYKARFGASLDLQIYHDGTHSYIDNDTGNLIIKADGQGLKLLSEGNIILRDNDDSTNMVRAINGGQVELYHNGTKKFETLSDGALFEGDGVSEMKIADDGDGFLNASGSTIVAKGYFDYSGSVSAFYTNNLGQGVIGTKTSQSFLFLINNALRMTLNQSGHLVPGVDSQQDLGLTGTRWRNVYADTLYGDGSNLTGVDAGFPSGTVMLFVQSSAPTGWTKQTGFNNRALRLVSSGSLGGGGGGSTTFSNAFNNTVSTSSGSVHNHTLTTSQIPSHNHTGGAKGIHDAANGQYGTSSQGSVGFPLARYPGSANYDLYTTSSTGGGSGHNHGFTNPNFNLNVSYVDVIYASKD